MWLSKYNVSQPKLSFIEPYKSQETMKANDVKQVIAPDAQS